MGKQEPNLHHLIKECAGGNRKYEELLYKSYYGYLCGVIFRYVRDRELIRQLVNEAFLRIFKKLGHFKFEGPINEQDKAFKGWIGKIAANIAIDHLRRQKVLAAFEIVGDDQLPEISIEMPDRLAYQEIIALLDHLPAMQSLIFNLHEIEGFSHDEIAQKLTIPASTSRVYLTRARSRLITCYHQITRMTYGR